MHNIFTKIFKRDVWLFGRQKLFEFLHLIGKGFQEKFNYLIQFTFIFSPRAEEGRKRNYPFLPSNACPPHSHLDVVQQGS